MLAQRVFTLENPYNHKTEKAWNQRGQWPTHWVTHHQLPAAPAAVAYRKTIALQSAQTMRAHISADERYELFLDGQRVAMGPERGDANRWFYETYDFYLSAGEHTFVALVVSLGAERAYAQMTVRHGWLFSPQSEEHIALCGTGAAQWEAKVIDGLNWTDPLVAWGTGSNLEIHGKSYPWNIESGAGENWSPAIKNEVAVDERFNESNDNHRLKPATLPAMLDKRQRVGTVKLVTEISSLETHSIPVHAADNIQGESQQWQALIRNGQAVDIGPHSRRRVLLDLDDYYCARPEIIVSGGAAATVRIHWQEALYLEAGGKAKGNRDEIEGKYFTTPWVARDGVGDTFHLDGGDRIYTPFWWQAGRYVEICVETKDEALTIENFCIRETRYPLELEAEFSCDDKRLEAITPMMMRALQMCAHETYMDCPYYEQLMYIGDTRLEILTTWAVANDDRLPRKAITMFDASRQLNGLTQSRYPTKVRQIIPPFSLWHCCMLHDRALWKNTAEFDRTFLPGVRGVLDYFLSRRNNDGLVESPEGWNYVDWVPAWPHGEAPGARDGCNASINWQTVLALNKAAELEAWHGEPENAERWARAAQELHAAIDATFWSSSQELYSEDTRQQCFAQHAQCLAVLSGSLRAAQSRALMKRVVSARDLAETTIMFRFYLLEAFAQTRNAEALWDQMQLWFQLRDWGFRTTWEGADLNSTRSDCHAWGAHPLFHYYASILGIRPASPGFETVHIAPLLHKLHWASGHMPHPQGTISVNYLQPDSAALQATVTLPPSVSGIFEWNGNFYPLKGGEQTLNFESFGLRITP